jgi:hypothetical protein
MTRSNTITITVAASSSPANPNTVIDSIIDTSGWDGSTITCTGPYRTVIVTITDIVGLIAAADAGNSGSETVGYFIAQHPLGDGYYWNVIG